MQYPVHIMNLASVRDLESKVTKDEELKELNPRRFRANIFGELFRGLQALMRHGV